MKKKKVKWNEVIDWKFLMLISITIIGVIISRSKPYTIHDFKQLNHDYVKGVYTQVNYKRGKSGRTHTYQYKVNGITYEASIGARRVRARQGDSCLIIYEVYNPKSSTIHSNIPSD